MYVHMWLSYMYWCRRTLAPSSFHLTFVTLLTCRNCIGLAWCAHFLLSVIYLQELDACMSDHRRSLHAKLVTLFLDDADCS